MALTKLGTEEDPKDAVERMLRAMAVVVWNLARILRPRKLEGASLMMLGHKTEVKEDHGDLWFNKACSSSRVATCVLNRDLKKGKKTSWYIYLGGGAVNSAQSELLQGAVV